MMKIGFDFDDVLCDFQKSWIEFNNQHFKSNLKYENMYDYDYRKVMGITTEEMLRRFKLMIDEGWFENFTPCVGAVETIKALKQQGHQLYIITARDIGIFDVTTRWTTKYFPECFTEIILTDQMSVNYGPNNTVKKSDIAKSRSLELMVDDAPHHIEDYVANNINCIMVNVPWNSRFDMPESFTPPVFRRINSLTELTDLVNSL